VVNGERETAQELPRILVCDAIDEEALSIIEDKGWFIDRRFGLDQQALIKIVPQYNAILVRSTTKIDAAVISAGRHLKAVVRAGSGLDNIDVKTAERLGIPVFNTPEANTTSVAEFTFAMIFSAAQRIPQAHKAFFEDREDEFKTIMIYGKTLGIVGLGRIGKEVAKTARGFGMKTIAYDPYTTHTQSARFGVKLVDLGTLLESSDVVTLHTPSTAETRGMFGEKEFNSMKKGAIFINVARGDLVDEDALIDAVNSGRIRAGLDVFQNEPNIDPAIRLNTQIVTTPHIAAYTDDAQKRAGLEAVKHLIDVFEGK